MEDGQQTLLLTDSIPVDICAGHLVAKKQAKPYSRCQLVTDIRLNKTFIETLTHAIQSGELAAKYKGISFARTAVFRNSLAPLHSWPSHLA